MRLRVERDRRPPLPAPPHFAEAGGELAQAWADVAGALRPSPSAAIETEVVALLLFDLRRNGPTWDASRFALFGDALATLRAVAA